MAPQHADGVCVGGGGQEELLSERPILAHRHQVGGQEGASGDCHGSHDSVADLSSLGHRETVYRAKRTHSGRATEATPYSSPRAKAGQAGCPRPILQPPLLTSIGVYFRKKPIGDRPGGLSYWRRFVRAIAWLANVLLPVKHEGAGVSAGQGVDVIDAMRDESFKRSVIQVHDLHRVDCRGGAHVNWIYGDVALVP